MGAMEGGGGGGSSGAYLAREYIWGPGDAWHPASVDELLVYFGENRQAWGGACRTPPATWPRCATLAVLEAPRASLPSSTTTRRGRSPAASVPVPEYRPQYRVAPPYHEWHHAEVGDLEHVHEGIAH